MRFLLSSALLCIGSLAVSCKPVPSAVGRTQSLDSSAPQGIDAGSELAGSWTTDCVRTERAGMPAHFIRKRVQFENGNFVYQMRRYFASNCVDQRIEEATSEYTFSAVRSVLNGSAFSEFKIDAKPVQMSVIPLSNEALSFWGNRCTGPTVRLNESINLLKCGNGSAPYFTTARIAGNSFYLARIVQPNDGTSAANRVVFSSDELPTDAAEHHYFREQR